MRAQRKYPTVPGLDEGIGLVVEECLNLAGKLNRNWVRRQGLGHPPGKGKSYVKLCQIMSNVKRSKKR